MTDLFAPKPVVVVPVHRCEPTPEEQYSLRRCGEVLAAHPIRIVHPAGLDLQAYRSLLPSAAPLSVPATWMASIRGYNRMMVNPAFYAKLVGFSHLLIHEPDALVLSDQLLAWCCQPYDYIGAPWFEGFAAATPESRVIGVGNSGFSLMRIAAVARALTSNYRWLPRRSAVRMITLRPIRRTSQYTILSLLRSLGSAGELRGAHSILKENFDVFLFRHFRHADPEFEIAPVDVALRFSWEVNPAVCMRLATGNLPFGIHAWARYDRSLVESLLS